ncbi:MAG TPA: hypothetical protein EYP59_02175 [Thiotrichaceae bacterium]|nr:hypothetical protein [Thiotrichaceae bacterium]
MSKDDEKWCLVNTPEQQTTHFDVSSFCIQAPESEPSPIDDFYSYSQDIIKLGKHDQLTNNPLLGRLLLQALMSGVELYFRSILSGIIKHCPRLTGIKIKGGTSVATTLIDFEKICQFRHAATHSRGQLSARN